MGELTSFTNSGCTHRSFCWHTANRWFIKPDAYNQPTLYYEQRCISQKPDACKNTFIIKNQTNSFHINMYSDLSWDLRASGFGNAPKFPKSSLPCFEAANKIA
jgi:hypothetical protein